MREWLIGNLGTKLMAFFLAILTWGYLYSQANRTVQISGVVFNPVLPDTLKDNLYMVYTADGYPLPAGSDRLTVNITGPTNEVVDYEQKKKGIRCEPRFSVEDFPRPTGSITHTFTAKDFDLPDTLRVTVDPPKVQMNYEKYVEKEVEIIAERGRLKGIPKRGYRIKAHPCIPNKVLVRVPWQSGSKLTSVYIREISIDGISDTADFPGQIDIDRERYSIRPPRGQTFARFSVRVEVEFVPVPKEFRAVALKLAGNQEDLKRIQIDPTSILVRVEGPKHVMDELKEGDFSIYVPINFTLPKVTSPDKRTMPAAELLPVFHNPEHRDVVKVTLMPDRPLDNRQVTITVLPEGKKP